MTSLTLEQYNNLQDCDLLKYGSFAVYDLIQGDFNKEYKRKETATRTSPDVFKPLLQTNNRKEKEAFIQTLNSDFIIYGLNWADAGSTNYGELSDFHYVKERDITSGKRKGANTTIVKLAKSVYQTPIENSFISDIVKAFPETDSGKITNKLLKDNPEALRFSIEKMQQELDIINPKALIFVHSKCAGLFKLFQENGLKVSDELEILTIKHYAATDMRPSETRKQIFEFTNQLEKKQIKDSLASYYSVMDQSK